MSEIKVNKIGGLSGATLEVQGSLSIPVSSYLYLNGDAGDQYIRGTGDWMTIAADEKLFVYADTYYYFYSGNAGGFGAGIFYGLAAAPIAKFYGNVRMETASVETNPTLLLHDDSFSGYVRLQMTNGADTSGHTGNSHEWTLSAKPTAEGAQTSARFNIFYGDQDGSGGGANILQCTGDGDVDILGTLSKGAGSFKIPHPDPEKEKTHTLWHSFIESPTAGENLYRWQLDVTGGSLTMELPDYYPFLNINDMVWVSPVGHFGAAYGEVSEDQKSLTITANADGKYNVLLMGTRKDEIATNAWSGVEREGPHQRYIDSDEND